MPPIKNLLFDLGKVLLDFNNDNAGKYLARLGVSDFGPLYQKLTDMNLFNDFETGAVTEELFISTIRKELKETVSRDHLLSAWSSIIIGFRTDSMLHLEKLKSDYRLFLLSNTNPLHLDEINRVAIRQLEGKSLDSYFEKTFYSHLMGTRKPSEDIYRKAMTDASIQPGETIFIDDLPENIAAAARLGFQTHQLLPEERIEYLDLLQFGFH